MLKARNIVMSVDHVELTREPQRVAVARNWHCPYWASFVMLFSIV